jgi:hypothetical protein
MARPYLDRRLKVSVDERRGAVSCITGSPPSSGFSVDS